MTNKTKNYKYSIKLKFDNEEILMLIDYPRRLTAPRLFYSVPIIRSNREFFEITLVQCES